MVGVKYVSPLSEVDAMQNQWLVNGMWYDWGFVDMPCVRPLNRKSRGSQQQIKVRTELKMLTKCWDSTRFGCYSRSMHTKKANQLIFFHAVKQSNCLFIFILSFMQVSDMNHRWMNHEEAFLFGPHSGMTLAWTCLYAAVPESGTTKHHSYTNKKICLPLVCYCWLGAANFKAMAYLKLVIDELEQVDRC